MADYDVIVVGSGIAGSCAAVEAAAAGASVIVVDRAELGGSSRLSSGVIMGAATRFQRAQGIEDSREALYHHYTTLNQWAVQPSLARRLCDEAGESIEWLADLGVEIVEVAGLDPVETPRDHMTRGGDAIMTALHARARALGTVDFAPGRSVARLVTRRGRVVGIATEDDEEILTGHAVVLATGGMAANHDMLAQWMPRSFDDANGPLQYVGQPTSDGAAVRLAQPLGAQVVGSDRSGRQPACGFGAMFFPNFVLMVNQLGRRYCDETTYGEGKAQVILERQPGATGYVIIDEATKQAFQQASDVRPYFGALISEAEGMLRGYTSQGVDDLVAMGAVGVAPSVAELATRIGVPLANLEGTLERYNRLVSEGADSDYCKPSQGLRPVQSPPFYYSKLTMGIFGLTSAGVRIDHEARVVHENSLPIPGLFAAGECTGGVLGPVYAQGGNSLANAATFGRVAGRVAAADAKLTAGAPAPVARGC